MRMLNRAFSRVDRDSSSRNHLCCWQSLLTKSVNTPEGSKSCACDARLAGPELPLEDVAHAERNKACSRQWPHLQHLRLRADLFGGLLRLPICMAYSCITSASLILCLSPPALEGLHLVAAEVSSVRP